MSNVNAIECAIQLSALAVLVEMGRIPQSELSKAEKVYLAILAKFRVEDKQIEDVSAEDVLNYLAEKYSI